MSLRDLKRAVLTTVRPVSSDRFIVGIRKLPTTQGARQPSDKGKRTMPAKQAQKD